MSSTNLLRLVRTQFPASSLRIPRSPLLAAAHSQASDAFSPEPTPKLADNTLPPSSRSSPDDGDPEDAYLNDNWKATLAWAADHFLETGHKWCYYPRCMTASAESLATFLFIHSFLLTFMQPLQRWLDGVWRAENPAFWWAQRMGECVGVDLNITTYTINYGDGNGAGNLKPTSDRGFIMHAFAGMLWLCVGYVQLRYSAKMSRKAHRYFGVVSLLSLAMHLYYAMSHLLRDTQQHHTIIKAALGSITLIAPAFCFSGMKALLAGNIRRHKDMMFLGFIWSISGAGPIRMIGSIQDPLGLGPSSCQAANNGVAGTECMWSYHYRQQLIALWNLYVTGAYCLIRERGSAGKQQDNTVTTPRLTKAWLRNVAMMLAVSACVCLLSTLPNATQRLNRHFGAPTTEQSFHVTIAMLAGVAGLIWALFPVLFDGWFLTYVVILATHVCCAFAEAMV